MQGGYIKIALLRFGPGRAAAQKVRAQDGAHICHNTEKALITLRGRNGVDLPG